MNVSQTLRTLRARAGFSQDYVAKQLGVSHAQYSKYETEQKELTLTLVEKLGKLYRLPPNKIFSEITETEYLDAIQKEANTKGAFKAEEHGNELSFYKKLAHYWEEKYMELLKLFIEKCPEAKNHTH